MTRSATRRSLPAPLLAVAAATATALALAVAAACAGGSGGEIRIATIAPSPGAGPAAPAGASPGARDASLPQRPGNPFSGGIAVGQYLAGGRANLAACLPELVQAWGMGPVAGDRCRAADIDGDGRAEFLFVVSFAGDAPTGAPADVWFYDDQAAGYRFLNSARALANSTIANARIVAVEDLTADRVADVVIDWQACEAGSCRTGLVIASQQGGLLDNLAPRDLALPAVDAIEVKDGAITLHGGLVTAAGAGPPRKQVITITWGGQRFNRAERFDPPTYLVHALNDADAAYAAGDFAGARRGYEQAATDTTLKDWKQESGKPPARAEIAAYALFRASLAAQRQGDAAASIALLDRAIAGRETTMSGAAAAAYRDALRRGSPGTLACSAAESYLATVAAAYAAQWNYGYANPERGVVTFCR